MVRFAPVIAAAALAGSTAVPAAAQYNSYPQPQPQPQPYPYPYPQPYPQPGYSGQDYGAQGTVGAIIDSLIGNRYNVSDRQAIRQCASAVMQRAQSGYGGYPGGGYSGSGYGGYNSMRVTSITDVERRSNGVRVRGTLGNNRFESRPYDPRYPNGGADRYGRGSLSFRCDVDYRGYVRNVRVEPRYRGY
jgi:hypothetical protein